MPSDGFELFDETRGTGGWYGRHVDGGGDAFLLDNLRHMHASWNMIWPLG